MTHKNAGQALAGGFIAASGMLALLLVIAVSKGVSIIAVILIFVVGTVGMAIGFGVSLLMLGRLGYRVSFGRRAKEDSGEDVLQ